jgi:hypothetical protein
LAVAPPYKLRFWTPEVKRQFKASVAAGNFNLRLLARARLDAPFPNQEDTFRVATKMNADPWTCDPGEPAFFSFLEDRLRLYVIRFFVDIQSMTVVITDFEVPG